MGFHLFISHSTVKENREKNIRNDNLSDMDFDTTVLRMCDMPSSLTVLFLECYTKKYKIKNLYG